MAETRWQDCSEPWERLKWARIQWQKANGAVAATAAEAAASLGMKDGTYRAYERPPTASKATPLDHQNAIAFGRKFKVSWRWLLLGQGTPYEDVLAPEIERVVQALGQLDTDRQRIVAEIVEGMLRTGTR